MAAAAAAAEHPDQLVVQARAAAALAGDLSLQSSIIFDQTLNQSERRIREACVVVLEHTHTHTHTSRVLPERQEGLLFCSEVSRQIGPVLSLRSLRLPLTDLVPSRTRWHSSSGSLENVDGLERRGARHAAASTL